MKYLILLYSFFVSLFAFSQKDSAKPIEADQETSFENYELLIIAVVGFALLMVIRYWFKRTRKP